jgi:tRNA-intron endonuclease, archaea type
MIQITFPQLASNSQNALTLAKTRKFGEKKQEKVIYSKYEAFYLFETKKAEIIHKDKKISETQFLKLIKQKDFQLNYLVFKDLRKKGYVVKTGLKFGEEFRVYSRPKNQKDSLIPAHAIWIVFPITQNKKLELKEFIAKNRIAHTTGKKLLIAIIDSQEDVTYFEVNWMKP